ncbi:nuclear envelope integral membrane protein 1 isoform X2 [Heterodontus francisci]|uniref:nuclear envelope integral membrane protein 1 isoform X2 n=1 Tax=Heterodontus francisci TaxID=7792 RepID=UPI00355C1FA0
MKLNCSVTFVRPWLVMAGGINCLGVLLLKDGRVLRILVAYLFLVIRVCVAVPGESGKIVDITEGQAAFYNNETSFCFKNALSPGWRDVWTRIQIRVNSSEKFKIKQADDEMELEPPGVWSWIVESATSMLKEKVNETYINVDLFSNKTCFKVKTSSKAALYEVLLTRRFDPQLIVIFTFGLLLFFYAETLSRSQLFFYTSGMSIGVLASLIILIFFLARLLPKKSSLYLLVAGGWSVSLYLIQVTLRNLQLLLREYLQYVLGYVIISAFVSFAVCYKYGPLEEERNVNLLNWALQLIGLLLMYCGIQVQQVALALIVVAFCIKNLELPFRWTCTACKRVFKLRGKPEPLKLLTEEEYQRQGEVETHKALVELQQYCSSPEFNAWKMVSRLSTPKSCWVWDIGMTMGSVCHPADLLTLLKGSFTSIPTKFLFTSKNTD